MLRRSLMKLNGLGGKYAIKSRPLMEVVKVTKDFTLYLQPETWELGVVQKDDFDDGVQYVFKFENNYGASVVKRRGSYGFNKNLWELAIVYWDNDDEWFITYDTDITSDVIGYLTNAEVDELLVRISKL